MEESSGESTPRALAVLFFARALKPQGLRHVTTPTGQCHFWFEDASAPGVPRLDLLMTLERPAQGQRLHQDSMKAFFSKLAKSLPADWRARWSTAVATVEVLEGAGVGVEEITDVLCPYG